MLNKIVFEGIVTNTWRYGSDLFVRMASYRDPNYPPKRLTNDARDEPDYVNIRFTNGVQGQLDFAPGTQLRVEGLLQSREYNESLAEFIEKARKANEGSLGVEVVGHKARHIMCGRSTVEILAQTHVVVQQPRSERREARKPVLAVQEKVEAKAEVKDAPVVVEVAAAA